MLREVDDGVLLAELMNTYCDHARQQIDAIDSAARMGDGTALKTLAHDFKSASFSVGAQCVGNLCMTLEAQASQGALADASKITRELSAHYDRLLPAFEGHLRP
ncbi:MAG: Hpt domain-containing protein [Burkholderiaceae bacterium]|nr:Hpt domain-containing protein [Burkholderiaceae bacterium]MDH3459755.1 Hpt domain-containing protein [Burkholderiaceae bacterium]